MDVNMTMTRKNSELKSFEKMIDERDDLECAISLLKRASSCISDEMEKVKEDLSWLIEVLEEETSIIESSINTHPLKIKSCFEEGVR